MAETEVLWPDGVGPLDEPALAKMWHLDREMVRRYDRDVESRNSAIDVLALIVEIRRLRGQSGEHAETPVLTESLR